MGVIWDRADVRRSTEYRRLEEQIVQCIRSCLLLAQEAPSSCLVHVPRYAAADGSARLESQARSAGKTCRANLGPWKLLGERVFADLITNRPAVDAALSRCWRCARQSKGVEISQLNRAAAGVAGFPQEKISSKSGLFSLTSQVRPEIKAQQ